MNISGKRSNKLSLFSFFHRELNKPNPVLLNFQRSTLSFVIYPAFQQACRPLAPLQQLLEIQFTGQVIPYPGAAAKIETPGQTHVGRLIAGVKR